MKISKTVKSSSNIVRTESVDLKDYKNYKKSGRKVVTTKLKDATPINHTI